MQNILIADDEKDIIKLLRLYLEKDDINVYEAYDGEMAYMIFKNYDIDLAIVDIMMPRLNGYELIKKIRKDRDIPIIIISAKVQTDEKILGLDLGADDYITKPFEPLEVAARVRAHLRRKTYDETNKQCDMITVGNITLNVAECVLYKGEERIELSKTEFQLLILFMENPGRVFTKEQLYETGWSNEYVVDDNTIRVIISRLRDKIGEERIKTVRGLGYRLEKNG